MNYEVAMLIEWLMQLCVYNFILIIGYLVCQKFSSGSIIFLYAKVWLYSVFRIIIILVLETAFIIENCINVMRLALRE